MSYSRNVNLQNQIGGGSVDGAASISQGQHSPSPKRGRFVTVNEQQGPVDKGSYTILSSKTSTNEKFKSRQFYLTKLLKNFVNLPLNLSLLTLGSRFIGNYALNDMEKVKNPEKVVRRTIEYSFDEVTRAAREEGQDPDRLVVLINSENLETSIAVHVQALNNNSVDSVLARFEIVEQSGRNKGRSSLYGSPFTIDVTALSHKQLKQQHGRKRGKLTGGRGGGRRLKPIRHRINEGGLIKIQNVDNLCLFRAINMLYRRTIMSCHQFKNYKRNAVRQFDDVLHLMNATNIPPYAAAYSLEDYGQRIVDYYNGLHYDKIFKIFGFGDVGFYKPYYQTNAERFNSPICVYYREDTPQPHFDAISNVATFFKSKYFCFSCCSTYSMKHKHNIRCKIRCQLCCVVDPMRGPCEAEANFEENCAGCGKIFKNR
jgi:hypothetical protein